TDQRVHEMAPGNTSSVEIVIGSGSWQQEGAGQTAEYAFERDKTQTKHKRQARGRERRSEFTRGVPDRGADEEYTEGGEHQTQAKLSGQDRPASERDAHVGQA